MAKITVQDTEITVIIHEDKDYISLTDMVRNMENGLALIEKCLRNKNTIEFLGIWEEMYNPASFYPIKQWTEQGFLPHEYENKAGRYSVYLPALLCLGEYKSAVRQIIRAHAERFWRPISDVMD